MRLSISLVLVVGLSACGPSEEEVQAALDAARTEAHEQGREEAFREIERALADAIDAADRFAGRADRILSPMPVMTPGEISSLRQYLNASHVARARELGYRVGTEAALDSLVADGSLVVLEDSTDHWIVRPGTAPAYVTPDLRALLGELGSRFQERLEELNLPPWRIEVTSALRTSERQDRLRSTNANAAAGVSSHEFGTTVDLSYAAFAPPATPPANVLAAVPPALAPHTERIADLALESVSARKSRELGAIFSAVLREAQSEGIALVIYETQQTVYHLTVGRSLADQ